MLETADPDMEPGADRAHFYARSSSRCERALSAMCSLLVTPAFTAGGSFLLDFCMIQRSILQLCGLVLMLGPVAALSSGNDSARPSHLGSELSAGE